MMLQRDDWHALRKPMLLLGTTALVMILLVGFSYQYDLNQALALEQAKTAHKKAQQSLQQLQQEQADVLQNLPQYQRLVDSGFIGEERRQQWISSLRKIREQHDLFEVDYDISQQEAYQPSFFTKPEGHQLYRSVMTVKLRLLHPGDLLHLLSGLRHNTPPFVVRDCDISRSAGMKVKADTLPANLKARCELDWLTLKPFDVRGAL